MLGALGFGGFGLWHLAAMSDDDLSPNGFDIMTHMCKHETLFLRFRLWGGKALGFLENYPKSNIFCFFKKIA